MMADLRSGGGDADVEAAIPIQEEEENEPPHRADLDDLDQPSIANVWMKVN